VQCGAWCRQVVEHAAVLTVSAQSSASHDGLRRRRADAPIDTLRGYTRRVDLSKKRALPWGSDAAGNRSAVSAGVVIFVLSNTSR
jgi:hypothetical protein